MIIKPCDNFPLYCMVALVHVRTGVYNVTLHSSTCTHRCTHTTTVWDMYILCPSHILNRPTLQGFSKQLRPNGIYWYVSSFTKRLYLVGLQITRNMYIRIRIRIRNLTYTGATTSPWATIKVPSTLNSSNLTMAPNTMIVAANGGHQSTRLNCLDYQRLPMTPGCVVSRVYGVTNSSSTGLSTSEHVSRTISSTNIHISISPRIFNTMIRSSIRITWATRTHWRQFGMLLSSDEHPASPGLLFQMKYCTHVAERQSDHS